MALTAAELQILVTARDRASQTLKNLQRETKGTSNAFAALGKGVAVVGVAMAAAAAGGVALFTKGLMDCVGEASEAQQVTAQLGAVLKSTGGVAGVTASAATSLADRLGLVTRFGDEAVLSAENLLLTFTNIGKDVFPQVTETVLDMAQSMGVDLKSAAQVVGKALNLPKEGVAALTRYGVQFTKATKDQIAALTDSGKLQEAQALILKELQTEFGGAARAAGATFAGQIDIARNAVGNLKEIVGEPLLKPLGSVVAKFIEFATRDDIAAAARDVGQSFANIAEKAAPALIEGLSNIVQFGRQAIGTVSDVVDILSGSYQDKMKLNFFGQPELGYTPSLAQRLSDAIRNEDWSAVSELAQSVIGAAIINGIGAAFELGNNILPEKLTIWLDAPETHQAAYDFGYQLTDDLINGFTGGVEAKFDIISILRAPIAGARKKSALVGQFANLFSDTISGAFDSAFGEDSVVGRALAAGFSRAMRVAIQMLTLDFRGFASDVWHGTADPLAELDWASVGTGISDAIISGLASLKTGAVNVLNEVIDLVNSLIDQLNQVPGVNIGHIGSLSTGAGSNTTSTTTGTSRGGGTPWYENIPGYAAGGYFRVPEGFPNDTFPILVQSGEHVAVWPRGMEPPAFDTGYYPGTYQPGPVPSGGGTSIVNSPGATVNYNNAGASSLGLAGLAGYQMQPGVTQNYQDYHQGPSAAQMYAAMWPSQYMSALAAQYQSVGVDWIDNILAGMSNETVAISGDAQGLIEDTFKRWWGALKGGSKLGSNIRRQVQDWMSDWMDIATTAPGETMASIAERMLNTAESYGGAVGEIMSANHDLFISMMGPEGLTTIAGQYDRLNKIFELGSGISGFGSTLTERYQAATVTPLGEQISAAQTALDQIASLDSQRLSVTNAMTDATAELTGLQNEYNQALANGYLPIDLTDLAAEVTAQQARVNAYQEQAAALQAQRDAIGDQVALTKQLVTAQEAMAKAQEKIAAFQKQQSDLAFLQAQLDFLQVIKANGLNAANILGGLELGINADLPGLLDAMTQAMQQIIRAAENEMGIHSKSRVMYRLGKYIDEGLAAGVAEHSGKPLGAMASMMAGMGAGGGTQNNWYLTAQYRYQDERSLRDDIWLLSRLHAGGVG